MAFYTVVLAECPSCKAWTDCKLLDCEECFFEHLEGGGAEETWKEDMCPHLECTVCGEQLGT